MSRLKWGIVGCLVLAGSAAYAENSKPRNILEFLFGTKKVEQPAAITPPPIVQGRAPAQRLTDKKQTTKSSRQAIDRDSDSKRRSIRKVSSIDPVKRGATGPYSGPFRGGGNQAYCVRTCDGFFFPINHEGAQGADRYDSACQQSCPGAQTQVYFMKRGGDIKWASTARGVSYASLENALKYRKERDPACSCKSQEQNWSTILAQVEPQMRAHRGDIVVTDDISRRIALGEDPMAIAKAAEKGGAEAAPSQQASASGKRAEINYAAPPIGVRSSFGERITPAHKFIRIDSEPTGSIPAKAPGAQGAQVPAQTPAPVPVNVPLPPKMPAAMPDAGANKAMQAKPVKTDMKADMKAAKPATTSTKTAATSGKVAPAKVATKTATPVQLASAARGEMKSNPAAADRSALRQALNRLSATDKR